MDLENLRLALAAATASTTSVVNAYMPRASLIIRVIKAAFNHRGAPGTFIGIVISIHTSSVSTRSVTDSHRGAPGTPIHINIGTVSTHTDTHSHRGAPGIDKAIIANWAASTRTNILTAVKGGRAVAFVPLRRSLSSTAWLVVDGLVN